MLTHGLRIGRLILSVVFVYAAWTKLRQPWEVFALSIDSYAALPEWAVVATARALPWFEMTLGVLLLLGVQTVAVSAVVSALLVGFVVAMLRAWWLDLGIDCGCFGIGQALSPGTLARDGALALLSLAVTAGAVVLSRRGPSASNGMGPGGERAMRWARTGRQIGWGTCLAESLAGVVWYVGFLLALGLLAHVVQGLVG
jgi:uncharacterized membrane protein YphA (DoxX/SURF4 family)